MTTTFADSTAVSSEFQFCLDIVAAKGFTPCLSTSFEDDDAVRVFTRESRSTGGLGRSPIGSLSYNKTTGQMFTMGFKK